MEKAIAIPDEVSTALTSRSCDSEQVICQLKESFQLDQSSLEKPDCQTKQLIRCFARKAELSNRVDVINRLREMTPAGTTGACRISLTLDSRKTTAFKCIFTGAFLLYRL